MGCNVWQPRQETHDLAKMIRSNVLYHMDRIYHGSIDEGEVEAVEKVLQCAIDEALAPAYERAGA